MEKRTYTIPLRHRYQHTPKYKRTNKAVRAVIEFLQKHMKADDVKIGKHLNEHLWKNGIKNPPSRVKVTVFKEENTAKTELFGFDYVEFKQQDQEEEKKSLKDRLLKKSDDKTSEKKTEKKEETKKPAEPKEKKEAKKEETTEKATEKEAPKTTEKKETPKKETTEPVAKKVVAEKKTETKPAEPKEKKEAKKEETTEKATEKETTNTDRSKAMDAALIACGQDHELKYVLQKYNKKQTNANVDMLREVCKQFKEQKELTRNRENFYKYIEQAGTLDKLE